MTKLKLTYFDSPTSRGEECRLALFAAGVDFEDNRIPRADWPALKSTTPFGTVPVLETAGKPPISQTNTILAYVGRRYGLLPSDEWEALRLESLLGTVEDLRAAIGSTFGINDPEELKRRRAAIAEGPIRSWGTNVERQIKGVFAGGAELSVADIKLYMIATWLKKGVLDHVPTDVLAPFPKLEALRAAVTAHPKIVAWYAR
jgi:prostaglandin-H2 D-isomerase / glutathione transferase